MNFFTEILTLKNQIFDLKKPNFWPKIAFFCQKNCPNDTIELQVSSWVWRGLPWADRRSTSKRRWGNRCAEPIRPRKTTSPARARWSWPAIWATSWKSLCASPTLLPRCFQPTWIPAMSSSPKRTFTSTFQRWPSLWSDQYLIEYLINYIDMFNILIYKFIIMFSLTPR